MAAAAPLLLLLMLLVTTVRVGADCRAQCAQCGDSTHPGDALRAMICTLECRSGLTVARYWRACQLFLGQDIGPAWVQQRSLSGVPETEPPGDESGPGPASPQQLDKKYGGFFRRVRSLVPKTTSWATRNPFAPETGSSPPSLGSVLDEIHSYLQTLDGSAALQQQQQQLGGVALPSGVADKRYGGFGRGRFRTKRGPQSRDDADDLRPERERTEEEEEEEEEEEDEEGREENGDETAAAAAAAAAAEEEEEEEDGQGEDGEMAPEEKILQKRYGGFMRRVGRPHKASWANQKRYGGFMRRFFGVSIRSEDSEGPADKRFSAYARRRLVQQ